MFQCLTHFAFCKDLLNSSKIGKTGGPQDKLFLQMKKLNIYFYFITFKRGQTTSQAD